MSGVAYEKSIRWVLDTFGNHCCTVKGTSMLPMLRQGIDTVALERVDSPSALSPLDVILFQREDGSYVLHRIVRVEHGANAFLVFGDNCESAEVVAYSQVLGVMTKYYRGESERSLTSPTYRAYVTLCCRPWQVRMCLNRALHAAQRAVGRISRHVSRSLSMAPNGNVSEGR